MISESSLADLRARNSCCDVAGKWVSLRRGGRKGRMAFLREVDQAPPKCTVDELMRMHVAARIWLNRLERTLDGKGSAPPVWPPLHKKTPDGLVLIAVGEEVDPSKVDRPSPEPMGAGTDAPEGAVLEAWGRFREDANRLTRRAALDDRELIVLFQGVRWYLNMLRSEIARRKPAAPEGDGG